jgi:ABC-type dipeptide/oligopeptide/nickel transport system ATPase component
MGDNEIPSPILRVSDLNVAIMRPTRQQVIHDASFEIAPREIFGLVGESGAGKTVVGKSILRLLPEFAKIESGRIEFEGLDLASANENELRGVRGAKITAVQQDPVASLNPSFTVAEQMTDILALHRRLEHSVALQEAERLLVRVGIADPKAVLSKFPFQLSGGMCQRVNIAVAFSCSPSLVIADEPTTALDAITQANMIELMREIQSHSGTSILFITHNLALASKIAGRVAVMQAGRIVETGPTIRILDKPTHAYTKSLIASIPRVKSAPVAA